MKSTSKNNSVGYEKRTVVLPLSALADTNSTVQSKSVNCKLKSISPSVTSTLASLSSNSSLNDGLASQDKKPTETSLLNISSLILQYPHASNQIHKLLSIRQCP